MSLHEIITTLSKLSTLHESLLELSKQKTEFLKDGNTEEIQKILVNEKKHIQAIQKLEQSRVQFTEQWFKEVDPNVTDYTLTGMIESVEQPAEKEKLNEIYEKLIITLAELKQQEKLNRDLTEQSLQFVQLSLDLLEPTIKNLNYGNEQQGNANHNRSIFDSKA